MGTRHPIPADLQLIGRTEELEALRDRLRATAAGTGTVVLIEGEAGIGKTRLVDEALSEATARGFQAFRGAAEELEGAQPFAPVVRSLSIEGRSEDPGHAVITDLMSRAVSGQQPVPPLQIPYPLFRIQEEILDFVERSAEVAPVLFALEDLHWADLPTLLLLRSAAHRLRYSPVAVLATFRPAPHHPQLDPVVAHLTAEGTPHLKLGPLSDDEVDSLVSQIVETPKPELRKRMSAAGGNPLFVLELLAAFAEEGMLEGGARPDALGGLGLPSSLRLTILRRLSYLSRDALELLKTAAVLGSPFSVGELSLITGRSGTDLTQPLGEAMRAGVLGEAGERLAFRHDLIREAVYEDMPVAIRRALHRDAARRLAAAGTPTVRVASQMAIGAEPGDSEAIDWLAQAGRDDKTGGLISAPLLERALELSLPADPRSDELVADLLWRLASSGRPAEAEALARDALSRPLASSLEARIRHGLAHALARAGDNLGALEEIRRAASMPGLPDEKLKEYLAFASQIALVVGDAEGAKAEAEQAVAAAERCGTGSPEALETLGWLANLSGYP